MKEIESITLCKHKNQLKLCLDLFKIKTGYICEFPKFDRQMLFFFTRQIVIALPKL